MPQCGTQEETVKWIERIFILVCTMEIVFGSVMIAKGTQNADDCNNGVDVYLYSAGILLVICNIPPCLYFLWKCGATSDGSNACMLCFDQCAMAINFPLFVISGIINLIWGTIVIFGSYPSWDKIYAETDKESDTYCPHAPVEIGFSFLVVNWVMTPLTFLLVGYIVTQFISGISRICNKGDEEEKEQEEVKSEN